MDRGSDELSVANAPYSVIANPALASAAHADARLQTLVASASDAYAGVAAFGDGWCEC